jgi:GntR family transcriptional regulator
MQGADEEAAERLRIKPGQPVFCLQRLRLADDEPLALETSQLYFIGCEKLLEEDFAQNSLYQLMENKYGILLIEAEQEIEAGLFDEEAAHMLKVPVNTAALFTRRITYTERDQPIEFAKAIYCGNKYTYYTHMKREQFMP